MTKTEKDKARRQAEREEEEARKIAKKEARDAASQARKASAAAAQERLDQSIGKTSDSMPTMTEREEANGLFNTTFNQEANAANEVAQQDPQAPQTPIAPSASAPTNQGQSPSVNAPSINIPIAPVSYTHLRAHET